MSAVTLTGRVVETPRFSVRDNARSGGPRNYSGNPRPRVRTTFEIAGIHSGSRLELHATDDVAVRIVRTLTAGDVIVASCWAEDVSTVTAKGAERTYRRIVVDSFTVRPREPA